MTKSHSSLDHWFEWFSEGALVIRMVTRSGPAGKTKPRRGQEEPQAPAQLSSLPGQPPLLSTPARVQGGGA